MLQKLFDRIAATLSSDSKAADNPASRARAIRHATAVLMIDVALADKTFDSDEFAQIIEHATSEFGLSEVDANELVESAEGEAENLVSLHDFTQLLHNNLSESEKETIIATLWRIAYADGKLDKYEDAVVLKISDGLHVARGRCMRLKHDATAQAGN